MDNWGYGPEDYEIEQDQYLRSLNRKSRKAEREAKDAIIRLNRCLREREQLIAICFMASMTVLIMAIITAAAVYGH